MNPESIARVRDLVNGNREPESGMEKHFLKVIKGDGLACTTELKEWVKCWKDLEKTSSATHEIPKKSAEKKLKKKEPMAIIKINGLWTVIKKTNEENTRFLNAERIADKLIAAKRLEKEKLAQVARKSKSKSSSATKRPLRKKPTVNMNTGWVSLSQGDKRLGDGNINKQYIDEGIAGTRNENKEMRKMQSADTLKRTRGG